ncbi:hypothetical protein [Vibrio sp.]|uniref:hypothetical protein n=1 Tax=Vibrio sp. TaxID=678 RepID=UPI003D13502D
MELKPCWSHYLKAKQLMAQHHWPEAHYLLIDVLHHLPKHLYDAAQNAQTKPCQFICLMTGLKESAIYQSDILSKMGQDQYAYQAINQTYALLQFLSIETSPLIRSVANVINTLCNELLEHIHRFCHNQRSASWRIEYQNVEKTHRYFTQLKYHQGQPCDIPILN